MRFPRWLPAILVGALVPLAGCSASGGASTAALSPTAYPTVRPTVYPTLIMPRHIFVDPLTAPDLTAWQNGGGCYLKADGYHINNAVVCLSPAPVTDFADGSVNVQVKQISGTLAQGYGLVVRARKHAGGSVDCYAFLIDGNGQWRALKVVGGQTTFFEPFTASTAIYTGLNAPNRLQVVMTGSHFDVIINETHVGQVDDTALSSGEPGFWGGLGREVVFTNFQAVIRA